MLCRTEFALIPLAAFTPCWFSRAVLRDPEQLRAVRGAGGQQDGSYPVFCAQCLQDPEVRHTAVPVTVSPSGDLPPVDCITYCLCGKLLMQTESGCTLLFVQAAF